MKISTFTFMSILLTCHIMARAEETETDNSIHKYWTCTISSYHSQINGRHQQAQCLTNTEYSEPPCRGFVVEYEGTKGIRPNSPFEQKTFSEPFDQSDKTQVPTIIKIEIDSTEKKFVYKHSVQQKAFSGVNRWVYDGLCDYNEAPASKKIYMDYGLKTGR
jgi:hypothetical protein